ncbi:unnamed protein product [Rotaria sp. Silwood2]|nr:unnamed protein product [Rotaria sp. Silwood2]
MHTITETRKGKKCLIFNGYRYLRDRIRNVNTYWRCENRNECPGRLTQKGDQIPVVTAQHNHEPNEEKIKQQIFRTHLKEQIRESSVPIRKIFRGEIINRYSTEPDSVCTLPQFNQIKNSLYRVKNINYPPLPKSIEDVSIEGNNVIKINIKFVYDFFLGKWRLYLNGENFTLADNKNPRYFVFGTTDSLKMLCSSDHIFADGTFKSSPTPFKQLYSIHIESSVLNNTLPVLYALLPDKFKATYTIFFNDLRKICAQYDFILNPRLITVDFEQGCLKSLQNIFPNSELKGCNFHFNKCIFKKITDLGWQQQYYLSSNDDLHSVLALYQKTCALAFMPVNSIDQLWCNIMDNFDHIPDAHHFFDYVTDTWIDPDALFPKKLWNYYSFHGLRTNNGLEGWHHRLNSNVGATNPNLFLVLEEIKKDYIFNMATLKQVQHQENKQRRKKQYVLRNRRIINLMDRYANGTLTLNEYFIKISKTIGKKNHFVSGLIIMKLPHDFFY